MDYLGREGLEQLITSIRDKVNELLSKPTNEGVEGQVLKTTSDGSSQWENIAPTTSNLLKGNGNGGIIQATPGTDYLKTAPVTSVNGKTGAVSLTASNVGAAPAYTYSTTDITAGTSSLATGTLYIVYE